MKFGQSLREEIEKNTENLQKEFDNSIIKFTSTSRNIDANEDEEEDDEDDMDIDPDIQALLLSDESGAKKRDAVKEMVLEKLNINGHH